MSTSLSRTPLRGLLILTALLALVAAACSNSETGSAGNATPAAASGDTTSGEKADLSGVPGVTDEAINFSVIGTKTNNPLGTCILDCHLDGIKAYFDYRNSEGGIYGRKLEVTTELDDELGQNQARALEVVTADDTFAAFSAVQLASGWKTIAEAGMPLYVWAIHPAQMTGHKEIFGHREVICITCTRREVAYVAELAGAKKVASLGYGISDSSKLCAQANTKSIDLYGDDVGADAAYTNDALAFGLPNGIAPEVTAMKQAGVDLILGCLDLNGMKTLAQELKRQGMDNVTLYHPNTYDQDFVKEAGDLFEGDYVQAQFRPFEADAGTSMLGKYEEWMGKRGAQLSEIAMVGWINADLAYQGLKDAGPNFDRQKVIEATNKLTAYTAGGLTQPVDWTRQHDAATQEDPGTHGPDPDCISVVKVKNGAFEVVGDKAAPWSCWPGDTTAWSDPKPMNFT